LTPECRESSLSDLDEETLEVFRARSKNTTDA
jgi:hypothetical protein